MTYCDCPFICALEISLLTGTYTNMKTDRTENNTLHPFADEQGKD